MNHAPLPPALANYNLAANEPVPLNYYLKMINTENRISNSALYTGLTTVATGIFIAQIAAIGFLLVPGTQPIGAAIGMFAFSGPAIAVEAAATAAGVAASGQDLWQNNVGPDQISSRIRITDAADMAMALAGTIAAVKGLKNLSLAADAVDTARIVRRVKHFFWGINAAARRPKLIGIAAWQLTKLAKLLDFLNVPALYAASARERAIIAEARRGLELVEKLRRGITSDGDISEAEEESLADEVMSRALRALMSSSGLGRSLGSDFLGDPESTGGDIVTKYDQLDNYLIDALNADLANAYNDFQQMEAQYGTIYYDDGAAKLLDQRLATLTDFIDTLTKLSRSAQKGEPNYDVTIPPFSGDVAAGLKDLYDERTPWHSDKDMFSATQRTSSDTQSLWKPHPLADFTRGLSLRIELLIAMGVVSPLTLRSIQYATDSTNFAHPDPLLFIRELTRSDCLSLLRLNGFTPASVLWVVEGGHSVLKASTHVAWTDGSAVPYLEAAKRDYAAELADAKSEMVWPTFLSVAGDPSNFLEKVLSVVQAQIRVAEAADLAYSNLMKTILKLPDEGSANLRAWAALLQPADPIKKLHGVYSFQSGATFISDETVKSYHMSFSIPLFQRILAHPGVPAKRFIDQFFREGRFQDSPHASAYRVLDGDNPSLEPAAALAKSGSLVGASSLTTVTSMSSYSKVPRFTIDARSVVTPDPDQPALKLINIPGVRSTRVAKSSGKIVPYQVWNGDVVYLKNASEVKASVTSHTVDLDPDTLVQDFSVDTNGRVYRLPLSALVLMNAFAGARVGLPYTRKDLSDGVPPDRKDVEYLLYRHLFEEETGAKSITEITKGYKFLPATSVWHNRRAGQVAINFPAREASRAGSGVMTIPSALLFNQSLLSEAASLDALTAMARSHDPDTMGSIRSAARDWRPER